jgi:hypothetical protein
MSLLTAATAGLLIGWQSLAAAPVTATVPDSTAERPGTLVATALASAALAHQDTTPDSLRAPSLLEPGPLARPVALTRLAVPDAAPQDTVPRRRAQAVEYSDAYYKRLTLHRALSWAMLPLFVASYVSGDQLLAKNDDAPEWAKSMHPVAATGSAVLFGANAITGGWNLWDGRKDPNGRKRRLLHSALFLAASGGFAYAGTTLADEAEQSAAKRRDHRNLALTSMGVSTASWLIMLIGN